MNARFLPDRFSSGEIGGTDGKGSGAAAVTVAGGRSSSSYVQVHPNALRESRCARGGGEGAAFGAMYNAAAKLLVRAVEAVDMRDGRTLLLCLVSERGLDSEVRLFGEQSRLLVCCLFLPSFLGFTRFCWAYLKCWGFSSCWANELQPSQLHVDGWRCQPSFFFVRT